jgi:hypothetical protein
MSRLHDHLTGKVQKESKKPEKSLDEQCEEILSKIRRYKK